MGGNIGAALWIMLGVSISLALGAVLLIWHGFRRRRQSSGKVMVGIGAVLLLIAILML